VSHRCLAKFRCFLENRKNQTILLQLIFCANRVNGEKWEIVLPRGRSRSRSDQRGRFPGGVELQVRGHPGVWKDQQDTAGMGAGDGKEKRKVASSTLSILQHKWKPSVVAKWDCPSSKPRFCLTSWKKLCLPSFFLFHPLQERDSEGCCFWVGSGSGQVKSSTGGAHKCWLLSEGEWLGRAIGLGNPLLGGDLWNVNGACTWKMCIFFFLGWGVWSWNLKGAGERTVR
jgi:hypothetical protein